MTAAAKKSSCFLLIFLVATALPLIPTTTALAKPSVPEFTVKVYDSSYGIPAKTTTDPLDKW
jgi:hypothetical protein